VCVCEDQELFISKLQESYDVAWVISTSISCGDNDKLKKALIDFHKSGRGLLIWGDNDPHYFQANLVLNDLVCCSLMGNDYGTGMLKFGDCGQTGFFDKSHIIFSGINNLYEGITIIILIILVVIS